MTMISENWADALEPGIREWTFTGLMRRPQLRGILFDVLTSQKASEHFETFGAITPDAWDTYERSGLVPEVDYDRGYKTTFTHKERVAQISIERKLIEDAMYPTVMDRAGNLGDSFTQKTETDAASVFVNAFSSSYLGGDGVALCSDAHPNSPYVSSTQDNNGTLALSKANVETTRLAMMAFKDDKGSLVGVAPDMLLVPPALEQTALEIVGSQLDPNTANNTVNVQFGRFKVVSWHYLTDSNAWFMIDSMRMRRDLKWFDRVPFSVSRKVEDNTVRATFIGYARYSFGWRDWRWVYGNNPS